LPKEGVLINSIDITANEIQGYANKAPLDIKLTQMLILEKIYSVEYNEIHTSVKIWTIAFFVTTFFDQKTSK